MPTAESRRLWPRHLLSGLVPVTVTVVIPTVIIIVTGAGAPRPDTPLQVAGVVLGALLLVGGLGTVLWTATLFHRRGRGTIGIGDAMGEPVNLVVDGPYRYVRNPMLIGIDAILLGEAAITGSGWLLLWFAVFTTAQVLHILLGEEPHLVDRYGQAYFDYRRNVPRWIPRTSPWDPRSA